MYVSMQQLLALGVDKETIDRKVGSGERQAHDTGDTASRADLAIQISSLPKDLQIKWAQQNPVFDYPEQIAVLLNETSNHCLKRHSVEIAELLAPLLLPERRAWMEEALRMSKVVERYAQLKPRTQRDPDSGVRVFTPGVYELCQDTVCKDSLILAKHPHRAEPLSPYTLDGIYRDYLKLGLQVFLPTIYKKPTPKQDKRRAVMSDEAVQWVNDNWRQFTGPYFLYNALKKETLKHGWKIPSESSVYRLWKNIPEFIKTLLLEGQNAYNSKHNPYVPRDYTDLQALQVLCGDHSQRDVTVSLPKGKVGRPWLSVWYDLRTGLIWGWHLSLEPSSHTAAQAYANGVKTFGAQPTSRPKDGFYSYIYTDQGRDYKSRNWDGKVLKVHKAAMTLNEGMQMLRVERRVGIADDLNIKHLLARGYNAREKAVERLFRVISEWEQNTFEEYCGRDAKSRPDRWRELYAQHNRRTKGKHSPSPFISFEQYRKRLAEFIREYNNSPHERATVGDEPMIPIEEYRRLYTTKYQISTKTLALLLMKVAQKTVGKDGVQCFRKNWFYNHEAMAEFKGQKVEVRYSEDDYKRVFVILPNSNICEAELITPTSIINPNQQTLKAVKQMQAHERAIERDFQLIKQSHNRGETLEDRTARLLEACIDNETP